MEFGYYPGCSLEGTAKEFALSLDQVLSKLDVKLKEINDWSCCGASSAHISSPLLATALPARNILLAGQQNMKEIVAPCAACYNRLLSAKNELRLDEKARIKVEKILGDKPSTDIAIMNLIQLFHKIGLDEIKKSVTMNLKNVKAACYYGCLLVRPKEDAYDDSENPQSMEKVVEALGAKTVNWNYKVECCGASLSIAHTDIVEKLSKDIMDDAVRNGADVIVVACPMCHSNLDMRQLNIIKHNKDHKPIPILYLSELVGLAFGIDPKSLGLNMHFIDPLGYIKKNILEPEVAAI